MKKLALIVLIILIVLAVRENLDETIPNQQKIDSMTGKIIHINDDNFYVEVLTGLHFDKAIVKLSNDCSLDEEDISKYSPQDILVFGVSYIDNSTSQAIIIANSIVSLKDKKTS